MDICTVPELLSVAIAADPSRPLITFYDDETSERTELSGLTLTNWVAKTANLLVDGCGLGPGSVARVRLPAHWQTAAILLGAWSAGVSVEHGAATAAGDVAFVAAGSLAEAFVGPVPPDEVFALALAPLAAPVRPAPPPGVLDYVVEVRPHGDRFTPLTAVTGQTVALTDGTSHAELVARAAARAEAAGWPTGARLLIDGDGQPDPLDWLLAPLCARASTVLCRRHDPTVMAARAKAERVTRSA